MALDAVDLAAIGLAVVFILGAIYYLVLKQPAKPAKPQEQAKQDDKGKKDDKAPAKKEEKKPAAAKKGKAANNHPQLLCAFKGHTDNLTYFRFSSTGKFAGTTGEDRRTVVWGLEKIPPSQALNLSLDLDHGVGIAFSPDDKFLAVAYARSKEIKIYPVKGAKEGPKVSFSTGHKQMITGLQWSYNGRFLVSSSEETKDNVRIFSPKGDNIGVINPGALETYSSVVSPDSRFISVASMQCDAKVWEVGGDKDGYRLLGKVMELTGRSGGGGATGHSAAVHSVDFGGSSPAVLVADSKLAATASKDGTCKIWNIEVRYKFNEDPKCLRTITSPDTKAIKHVALSKGAEAKWVATWSASAGLCFFSTSDGVLKSQISVEDTGTVFLMEWSPSPIAGNDDVLATASADGKTRFWIPNPP